MNPGLNMIKGSPADFKIGKMFGGALNVLGLLGKKKSAPAETQGLSKGSRYFTPTNFGKQPTGNKPMMAGAIGGLFGAGMRNNNVLGGAVSQISNVMRSGKFASGKSGNKRRGIFGGALSQIRGASNMFS